jgi:hypothetical protein
MRFQFVRRLPALLTLCLLGNSFAAQEPAPAPAPRPPAASLKAPTGASQQVDDRGFIRRWMVLEPIPSGGQLTESAVETAVQGAALPGDATAIPRDGDTVDKNGPLRWHALETKGYNVNLYHFAWALTKPTSNVLFWVVTTVDAPQEMRDVRLAICSNAASQWWLNGERVIGLYNDRQAVIDDGVSKRVTLRKGRNVIRAAIINGGGATDFCARFLDSQNRPITNLRASLQPN